MPPPPPPPPPPAYLSSPLLARNLLWRTCLLLVLVLLWFVARRLRAIAAAGRRRQRGRLYECIAPALVTAEAEPPAGWSEAGRGQLSALVLRSGYHGLPRAHQLGGSGYTVIGKVQAGAVLELLEFRAVGPSRRLRARICYRHTPEPQRDDQPILVAAEHLLELPPPPQGQVRRPWRPFWRPFWLRLTYVTSVLVKKY
jgi:hypothetical protein